MSACNSEGEPARSSQSTSSSPLTASTIGPDTTVGGFEVDSGFPVNMLDGQALDDADVVLITEHERIDLATGHIVPIEGLPDFGERATSQAVEAAGEVIVTGSCPTCTPPVEPDTFALDGETARPLIATGSASPGIDGIWVTVRTTDSCSLSEIDLAGTALRPPRPITCELFVDGETALGVVAHRDVSSVLINPDTWEVEEVPGRVMATFDRRALISVGDALEVHEPATSHSVQVDVPESDGSPGPAWTSPDERFVVVMFGHPAWPGPRQLLDLWLLDTENLQWSQLPQMPVAAALKSLAIDWTPDGRIVVLGSFDGVGTTVAMWTPGDRHLAIRPIDAQRATSMVATLTDAPR